MHAGPDNDSPTARSSISGADAHPQPCQQERAANDRGDLQTRLIEILKRISGANPEQITPDARLIEDVGIDSLGYYEILIEIDECLGIKIREEDLLSFRTVGDVQRHLQTLEQGDDKSP